MGGRLSRLWESVMELLQCPDTQLGLGLGLLGVFALGAVWGFALGWLHRAAKAVDEMNGRHARRTS